MNRAASLPAGAPAIHLVRLDATPALDLSVAPGEGVALVGGAGSGKTALLRAAVGLLRLAGTQARIAGVDLGTLPHLRRRRVLQEQRLAFLPQEPILISNLSVFENLLLPATFLGERSRADAAADAIERLSAAGLAQAGSIRPATLPPEDRRLVALLRGMLRLPKVALLDEPLLGLSSQRVALAREWIGGALGSGCAVLVATRDAGPYEGIALRPLTLAARGSRAVREDR